jgi:hypothetical protein
MLIYSIVNVNWVQKYVRSALVIIRQCYQCVKLTLIGAILSLNHLLHHNHD